MTFEEYQQEAVKFRTESANNEEYLTLGLIEEVGEAAGKLAKRRRDGVWDEKAFIKELGDILWFVANLADYYDREHKSAGNTSALGNCFERKIAPDRTFENAVKELAYWAALSMDEQIYDCIADDIATLAAKYDYTLERVAEINLAKLRDRAARGQIQGNGDER